MDHPLGQKVWVGDIAPIHSHPSLTLFRYAVHNSTHDIRTVKLIPEITPKTVQDSGLVLASLVVTTFSHAVVVSITKG